MTLLIQLEIEVKKLETEFKKLESISWFKDCSLKNEILENIEAKPNPEIKSETNIDWNFVLGLVFGIGYLIFGELKDC